jgi:hypothetical protein
MLAILEGMAGILGDPIPIKYVFQGDRKNTARLTFCACWAIISTSEKSYIPRAVSNRLFASTRNMIYFRASSTKCGSFSIR